MIYPLNCKYSKCLIWLWYVTCKDTHTHTFPIILCFHGCHPFSITQPVFAVFPLHLLVLMTERVKLTSRVKQDIIVCGVMHTHSHKVLSSATKLCMFIHYACSSLHSNLTYSFVSIIALFFRHLRPLHWDLSGAEFDKSILTPCTISKEKGIEKYPSVMNKP